LHVKFLHLETDVQTDGHTHKHTHTGRHADRTHSHAAFTVGNIIILLLFRPL